MAKRINAKVDRLKELRKRAEERLEQTSDAARKMSHQDLQKLVHELGVYHVELEMQNEELSITQHMLLESREKYYRLFDFAPVAFFGLDENGVILEANRAALGLTGLIGRDLTKVNLFGNYVHTDDRAAFRNLVKNASASDDVATDVIRIVLKDGSERILNASCTRMVTEEGRPAVMLAANDITRLIEAENEKERAKLAELAAIEEAEQLRVQRLENLRVLAGGIAHDLNNLMVAVQANTELALGELDPGIKASEYVQAIDTAASRVSGLARQILSYTGKQQTVKESLELSTVARDTVGLLIAAMPKDTHLEFDYSPDELFVEADYQSLQQVMMNLIINAGESLQGGAGKLSISTGSVDAGARYLERVISPAHLSPGRYAYFEVSDTGCGIAPETVDKIFEAFYTTKSGGRGLGMSVVARMAETHGGGVEVETERGRGTRMRLLIPLMKGAVRPKPVTPPPPEAYAGSGTVLLVDDEPTVLGLLERILRGAGYEVLTAVDGDEAVDVFRDHASEIAAVVMDLIMPRMHGDNSAREIRKIRKDARIILLSGYHELEIDDLMKGPGKTSVLSKPCRARELLYALRDLMSA